MQAKIPPHSAVFANYQELLLVRPSEASNSSMFPLNLSARISGGEE